jgi:lipopolysaccharide transport system ATP-binding protein
VRLAALAEEHVGSRYGLVQEQHVALDPREQREGDARAHAARVHGDGPVEKLPEPGEFLDPVHVPAGMAVGKAQQVGGDDHVPSASEIRAEPQAGTDHGHHSTRRTHCAFGGLQHAGQQAEERRLPGAVGPEDPQHLPALDAQRHVAHGPHPARREVAAEPGQAQRSLARVIVHMKELAEADRLEGRRGCQGRIISRWAQGRQRDASTNMGAMELLRWLGRRLRSPAPTVLHVTHPKAGSQWVYAVLLHLARERIVRPTVDSTHALQGELVPGRIYPTVYATSEQVAGRPWPPSTRVFVVIRDLRDTLVSLYFSLRFSHPILTPHIQRRRDELAARDFESGLAFLLESPGFQNLARIQESWIGTAEPLLRYEELLADDLGAFRRIVAHCGLPAGRALRRAVARSRFEAVSGRQRGEEKLDSHHRKGVAGDWRGRFSPALRERFKELYGRTLIRTGYAADERW